VRLDDPAVVMAAYLLAINVWAFGLFAWDKSCARRGDWRVAERTLLWVAFAGGSVGAVIGQRMLRHKTRKEPFRSRLLFILGVHSAILVSLGALGIGSALAPVARAAG
jgi:uncharacterized membrane protein YsdA (DUF1294 family)